MLEAAEAADPALFMQFAGLRVGDALVEDDDFGAVFARFETDGDAFADGGGADAPGVDEAARRIDRLEFAGDGDHAAVGEAVVDSPAAADAKVDFGRAALHAVAGREPAADLLRPGPG